MKLKGPHCLKFFLRMRKEASGNPELLNLLHTRQSSMRLQSQKKKEFEQSDVLSSWLKNRPKLKKELKEQFIFSNRTISEKEELILWFQSSNLLNDEDRIALISSLWRPERIKIMVRLLSEKKIT